MPTTAAGGSVPEANLKEGTQPNHLNFGKLTGEGRRDGMVAAHCFYFPTV